MTTLPHDRETRRRHVEDALHSGEMEGLHVGPETRADAQDYIDGLIDAPELVARTRIRYGLAEEQVEAEVVKGQQLAGHFPNEEAIDRGRRIFRGEMTLEEAHEELRQKHLPDAES